MGIEAGYTEQAWYAESYRDAWSDRQRLGVRTVGTDCWIDRVSSLGPMGQANGMSLLEARPMSRIHRRRRHHVLPGYAIHGVRASSFARSLPSIGVGGRRSARARRVRGSGDP